MTKTNILTLETNLANGPCEPVGMEIGTGGTADISVFNEFPDIFEGLSNDLEAANVRRQDDLETGEAAKRTMVSSAAALAPSKKPAQLQRTYKSTLR